MTATGDHRDPYEVQQASRPPVRSTGRSYVRLLGALWWAWPFLLVAAFYASWLTAWLILGHRPRVSLDDPSSISWMVDVVRVVAGVLLVGFPAAVICGCAAQLLRTKHHWHVRILLTTLMLSIWFAALVFLRWDPLQVGDWYFD